MVSTESAAQDQACIDDRYYGIISNSSITGWETRDQVWDGGGAEGTL